MDINNIRIFVDVMNMGSFAEVARHRDVDPSKISRAISTLENSLGFRLFQRTTRHIAPTEAGNLYFHNIQDTLKNFDTACEKSLELINQPMGILRVAACTSFGEYGLAPIVAELKEKYPELIIELILSDHQIDIIHDQIDVALRFGKKPDADFISSRLFSRSFKLCASPKYLNKNPTISLPDDLISHNCLLFSTPSYDNIWKYRRSEKKIQNIKVSGNFITSHGMTMTKSACLGMGIALIPNWLAADALKSGELIEILPEYDFTPTEYDTALWIVYPSREYIPLKLRTFIDFLKMKFD